MNEIIEYFVVFEQVVVRARNRNFVRKSPYYDRRVIVVLRNKLLHLRDSVLASAGKMLRDIGNLRPDNETALVAEIVEILVVLIVSKTDGGCTYLADEVDIFLMMLGKKRVSDAPSVLMARYTAEGILFSVKDESVLGIDLEGTATEAG